MEYTSLSCNPVRDGINEFFMKKPRDRNIEKLHHRGGKGAHRIKKKDAKRIRKRLKEKIKQILNKEIDESL
jgi:predicted ABC-type ATPase